MTFRHAVLALLAAAPLSGLAQHPEKHGTQETHPAPAAHAAPAAPGGPAPAPAGHGGHEASGGPSADQALQLLKAGHGRFVTGRPTHPDSTIRRVHDTAAKQRPYAVVLGCADSRTPPEVLLDQGIGDIFVVRVAGQVAEPATVGSIEYAVEHLGAALVVVMGHHRCGAVKATIESEGPLEGNIGAILKEIQPAVEQAKRNPTREGPVDTAVHANVARVAAELSVKSPLLRKLLEEGKIKVVTAVYDLAGGTMEWGK